MATRTGTKAVQRNHLNSRGKRKSIKVKNPSSVEMEAIFSMARANLSEWGRVESAIKEAQKEKNMASIRMSK